MARTEYKVVPAPERARKVRGLKGANLFAHEVEALMNDLAAEGWHYLRADTLPQEERAGLTSKVTTYRNLLIFRRDIAEAAAAPAPTLSSAAPPPAPQPTTPKPEPEPDDDIDTLRQPAEAAPETSEPTAPRLFPNRQSKGVDL